LKYSIRATLLVASLTSCTSNVAIYEDRLPNFEMNTFFNGKLCAWGVVKSRNGEVSRKFVADINATASQDSVQLDEKFTFDNGEKQNRVWKFVKRNQQWIGSAGDVVGEALGEISGDSLHLVYDLTIQSDGDQVVIAMDDWLHLVDKRTLLGTTNMTKWGFNVGRIDITIQQRDVDSCIQ